MGGLESKFKLHGNEDCTEHFKTGKTKQNAMMGTFYF